MSNRMRILALATIGLATAPAALSQAQNVAGIKLNPGERLVAVNGVPVNSINRGVTQASYAAPSSNIVGQLQRTNQAFSHTPGSTALDKANAERARQGQRPLLPDPNLQALALRKATMAAQRGYKNHVEGSLGGAKCEGVGWTNGRFLSCCLNEPGTYGGAAMVKGADGWYCCLLVR
ncbi:MAG: hypothetical protein KDA61_06125 [Planctomycetales bacterium]|nr:hypothetical protein [Planctomycetales bacterium]